MLKLQRPSFLSFLSSFSFPSPRLVSSPSLPLSSPAYLQKELEVRLVVRAVLEQSGTVDLTGAEPDVRLHVGQFCCQDVSDLLDGHVLTCSLLTGTQCPANIEHGTCLQ